MKIGIQTWGSRGDINPWIAIGKGLAEAGHNVTLYYTSYTNQDFSHHSGGKLEVITTKKLHPNTSAYDNVYTQPLYLLEQSDLNKYIFEIYDLFEEEVLLAATKLCHENDLIINHPNSYQIAILAEKYGIPRITIRLDPEFSDLSPNVEKADRNLNQFFQNRFNILRKQNGLSPITDARSEVYNSKQLNLLIYSRIFYKENEKSRELYKCVGFQELIESDHHELPNDLVEFLNDGEAPIFFSMGSLAFFEGENFDILDIFEEAIALSGCRAIIQGSWSKIKRKPRNNSRIYLVDYVSHATILPKCKAIVHHGGAGTTHTAIKYGCPSIVIAYAWDQFYWGKELVKLGCSPDFMKRKYLDSIQLAGAIQKLLKDSNYNYRAYQLKCKMKREKRYENAVDLIEKYISENLESVYSDMTGKMHTRFF